jgi:hypothetical protein
MMYELLTALLRGDPVVGIPEPAHALAALLLVDEPFGFTADDARALLQAARHLEHGGFRADAARFVAIAERIEALTPPEER